MSDRPRALVTGAGRRLGLEMAIELGRIGYDVALHYHGSSDGALEGVEKIESLGGKASAHQTDLLVSKERDELLDAATQELGGPLSVLINNASIFENDTIGSITEESWSRAIESNLRAAVMLTQAFAAQAPRAIIDKRGEPVAQSVVINLIDQRVWKLTPHFMSYSLAKSALLAFTKTSAQAMAPDIRVGAIGPGPTLAGDRQSETHFKRQRDACILQRGSNPEDILCAMRFILDCNAFTGQMLAIDGGQHLVWLTPDIQDLIE